ncbi:MAG: hypothetical protein M3O35_15125 [Acidobacteriota bacterium]|nr:hypothetical protein [Acidobacteriota bacterium]
MRTRRLVLVAPFLASAMAADIPIRTVILYKNGVGYFERAGDLKPGESARLDFRASDMNDVLKSLTLTDLKGAKVSGLRYDSSETLEKKLAEFPFQLGEREPLSSFLDRMKGARVELKSGPEAASGTIVGARAVAGDDKHPPRDQVVLLVDAGEMRTFDLAAVTSLKFTDPVLQVQLRDYLTTVNQSRSKEKRSVYIDSSDAKDRQIVASYMLPTAVWKSSYRLIFPDQGQPTLEGWAIVDNTSGEDWTNVRLAVVSGRPVSFISNLYEPRYVERETAELPEEQALGPVLHKGAVENWKSGQVPPPPPAAPPMNGRRQTFSGLASETVSVGTDRTVPSGVNVATDAVEAGELFEYRFSSPVNVKKSESTMLPFLQQKLGARKLLIYSESYGAHPMTAAELTNTTGKTLDGGPITVFDAGTYAGEALIETLKAGDKRLISYAQDQGVRITTKFDSENRGVREIRANRGLLTMRYASQETKTFTIRNVDQKPKTLLIEHPVRGGYKLLNQTATETTADAYRFEVKLTADSTQKFAINEERLWEQSTSVSSLTPDMLFSYVQNKTISDAARGQLQQILDLKRQLAAMDGQISQTEAEINELTRDQDRVRQNLVSLNQVSGQQEQVQVYARQLADQEKLLAGKRDSLSGLRKQRAGLDASVKGAIDKLEF